MFSPRVRLALTVAAVLTAAYLIFAPDTWAQTSADSNPPTAGSVPETHPSAPPATTTAWIEWRSAYVVGQALELAHDACLNLDILHKRPSGASAELIVQGETNHWGLNQMGHYGNELDGTLKARPKTLGIPGQFAVGIVAITPVSELKNDFWFFGWELPTGPLTWGIDRLQDAGSDSFGSGSFFRVEYAPSVNIGKRLSVDAPVRALYDTGVGNLDPSFIVRFKPQANLTIGKGSTLYAGWEGDWPLSDRDDRDFHHAFRGGLKLVF